MQQLHNQGYKATSDHVHQLQENCNINWIIISSDLVSDATNSYFEQIRTPEGILLRRVDIFKENNSQPEGTNQPADY